MEKTRPSKDVGISEPVNPVVLTFEWKDPEIRGVRFFRAATAAYGWCHPDTRGNPYVGCIVCNNSW